MSIFRGKRFFLLKGLLALCLLVAVAVPLSQVDAGTLLQNVEDGGLKAVGETYGQNGAPSKSIIAIVVNIIKVFLGLLGLIFLVLTIMAGFKWVASQGDAAKITAAKGQLQASIIGLLIILSAYSITLYVVNCTLKATGGSGADKFCPSIK